MGRPCPVCGRGMFRRKALLRHIRKYHPTYYQAFIASPQGSMVSWCLGLKKKSQKLPEICKRILCLKEYSETGVVPKGCEKYIKAHVEE